MKAKTLSIIALIFTLNPTNIHSQQSDLSKAVNYLSEFIASDYFIELKKETSDLALVDTIYLRAIDYYQNDYAEALLSLTFTTVPYREVPLKIPLFNLRLSYPLISADEQTFKRKNENLPSRFLHDSPENDFGDKDKIAHFFGNAYIGYAESILDLADVFGYFVEAFEEDFKAQSKIDFRDIEVNWLGVLFGNLLEENKKILPSEVIITRSLRYSSFVL
ncbi:MAG: hypothetical protein HKP17_05795 [Ignavibacteriaceae bacterium]|nr:hypothetical protein [Ignavibacteriaceae bacterium]